MSGYVTQPTQGPNYQPQVPSTHNGPIKQTYVPRHSGNAVFVQSSPGGVYATAGPVPGYAVNQPIGVVASDPSTIHAMPVYQQQNPMVAQPVYNGPAPQIIGNSGFQAAYYPTPANATYLPGSASQPQPQATGLQVAMGDPSGFFGPGGMSPSVAGIGKTAAEVAIEQAKFAHENNLFEPQDFKPADDNPGRFYAMRQLDGFWTYVSRATIDKLSTRWMLVPNAGLFYAIRLED